MKLRVPTLIYKGKVKRKMIRPIDKKFWKRKEKQKKVEKFTEEVLFTLTPEEFKKCRFEIKDMTTRSVECTVHRKNYSHGFILHPPHLYLLKDKILYMREKDKWVLFEPRFKERS